VTTVTTEGDASDHPEAVAAPTRRRRWAQIAMWGALPTLVMVLAAAAGYAKYEAATARDARQAGIDAVQAARESTVALLSYQPAKIDQQLGDAGKLLTGDFKDSYSKLIHDVVIPGAKQRQISAQANVPAAASVSATPRNAVVVAFVNQAVTVGDSPPTNTASSVRVTLDKSEGRWLISAFDPI
jgi:Mce-associated membrane protein